MPLTSHSRPVTQPLTRREVCRAALTACLLPGMVACTRELPEALTVGMNAWVGYDPLALARDRGLIDVHRVKVVGLSSSSETLRYMRNGLLDAGALTLDEVLRLSDEGVDVRVVALLDTSMGADAVMADPALQQLADLRGSAIAVESSTVGALMLRRLLQSAGLDTKDVTVVHLEATQHLDALREGRVRAAVSYEPIASSLHAAGYQRLFDSRSMPGDIVDVLVVRAQVLDERTEDVAQLIASWNECVQVFVQSPDEVARLMGPAAELTPEDYLQVLGELRLISPEQSLAELSGDPPLLAQTSGPLARTLQDIRLIQRPPDWRRLAAPGPAAMALARAKERS